MGIQVTAGRQVADADIREGLSDKKVTFRATPGTQQGARQKTLALESLSEDLRQLCICSKHICHAACLWLICGMRRAGKDQSTEGYLYLSCQPVPEGRRQALG